MLCSIQIRDLAVVASLDLDFEAGLSVLTGETGAGKSILLTALGLALGDRADSGIIRPGSKRAEIHLEFDVGDAASACQWLKDQELNEDDSRCLIRRVIKQDGRSQAFVNDRPVTLSTLQALGSQLVEIHGQHAHIGLLKGATQQKLLDTAAGNQPLLEQLSGICRAWKSVRGRIEEISRNSANRTARQEILSYQIDELQQLDIEDLDYPALQDEHGLLANLGQVIEKGQLTLLLIDEGDEPSAGGLLGQAQQALESISEFAPELHEINGILDGAQVQLQEAGQQLRRLLDSLETDPARLEWLNERLSALQTLARKHQTTAAELPQRLAELQAELDSSGNEEQQLDQLRMKLSTLETDYQQHASELSLRRQEFAAGLQQKISGMIRELGMPHSEFLIAVESRDDQTPVASGHDQIEFLVSANPGLPPRPLAKVASGGELSRISLAIQVATTQVKTTPTMVFDEVDSGIGGGVAEIVGQRLRSLGTNRQVLCVTHLPQVAAQAHHHLLVEKSSDTEATQSQVRPLTLGEKQQEIARMLGGVELTEQTLAHAAEMLSWAESQP